MTLKEQITEDMKTAMRAKDSERLGTIRLLLAACKQKEVDERVELDDAMVVSSKLSSLGKLLLICLVCYLLLNARMRERTWPNTALPQAVECTAFGNACPLAFIVR